MIRILIADDHAVVRRGLKDILGDTLDMVIVAEAASGAEALRAVVANECDVILLDIALPDLNGLEVLKQIRQTQPNVRVLILSAHPEAQYAERALRSGAAGYLTKDRAPEELIEAIRKAHGGGKYVSETFAESLAALLSDEAGHLPHESLSDREYEVLRLLAKGKTVMEIAAQLRLSDKTISTYRARILEKLNLKNTAEIVRYALQQGLVE